MAAQGSNKELVLCEKCFAMMPAGAEFFAECGAPLVDKPGVEGSDGEIYPELARANLLRMRAEYDQASKICLSILRRYPNNATANTLLGDIAAERGDLEQAAEWYELALDIIPDSPADKAKLEAVKRRMAEREAATTAEQLGLPTKKAPVMVYGLIILAICVLAVIGAYVLGQRSGTTVTSTTDVNKPVVITDPQKPQNTTIEQPKIDQPSPQPAETAPSFIPDITLYQALLTKTGLTADNIFLAEVDPRSRSIRILYRVPEGADGRAEAARIAVAAMEHGTEAPQAHLQGIRQGQIVFDKSVTRDAFNTTTTPDWQSQHQGQEGALADALFGPAAPAEATDTSTTTATTGTTPQ